MPVISVVMPVYNAGKYLEGAICSILSQTFFDFEFIISYDESSDDSLKIINKYQKIDDRIILLEGNNQGLVKSLNEAIKLSKGKYVARMDADDIATFDRFEKQIKLLENSDLDICGGHYLSIDCNGKIIDTNLVPITHDMCSLSLSFKVPFAHPSVMIRKRFLIDNDLKYGQSKYKIAEDLDLWVRMHGHGAIFGNVDDIVLKYRILEDSLSRVNKKALAKDTKDIFGFFYKKNYLKSVNLINKLPILLNSEESSLIVRFLYVSLIKNMNILNLRHLKRVKSKIIIYSVLSEMVR